MANTKSAAKRARQITRRTRSNMRVLTSVKTHLRTFRAAVAAGKTAEVRAMMPKVVSVLDKAAKTGRLHRNKANRHKSEMAASVAALK
jgi:small subunit ribosomal protein S20